ncbi:hypothetical protein AX17_005176 [Amanita inopinata Kibby_2008]|nr:hypothetical protein AX17_005176 [Amanita inopinata Kibby_2008]
MDTNTLFGEEAPPDVPETPSPSDLLESVPEDEERTNSFDSPAKVDVILRSSDSVDFFVSSILLRLVTPIFDSMISLNKKSGNNKDGVIVVSLTEDSIKLRHLLLIIHHHIDVPEARDAPFLDISLMAQKYGMKNIESQLRKQFQASDLVTTEPMRAYVIAVKLGWEPEARHAATNALAMPLQHLSYIDELRAINGAEFYHFLKYRFECVTAVEQIFENIDEWELFQFGHVVKICGTRFAPNSVFSGRYNAPNGFSRYVTKLQDKLKIQPLARKVTEESDLESVIVDILEFPPKVIPLKSVRAEKKTGTLSNDIKQTIESFFKSRKVLAAAVEEAVSKVILEFEDWASTGLCTPCQNIDALSEQSDKAQCSKEISPFLQLDYLCAL